jgi:hypothetical protein
MPQVKGPFVVREYWKMGKPAVDAEDWFTTGGAGEDCRPVAYPVPDCLLLGAALLGVAPTFTCPPILTDVCSIDKLGHMAITDRSKDVVKSGASIEPSVSQAD